MSSVISDLRSLRFDHYDMPRIIDEYIFVIMMYDMTIAFGANCVTP